MNTEPSRQELRRLARRRFKQLMLATVVATILVLIGAFTWLNAVGQEISIHFALAISIAVVGSLALAAALMGLVFFSNTSGVDQDQRLHDSHEDPANHR